MKKFVSILVAMIMILSMTAMADVVPSKTTTDTTVIISHDPVSGVEVDAAFDIFVTVDTEPVVKEIVKMYNFVVKEENAPVAYFPEETQELIKKTLAAKLAGIENIEEITDVDAVIAGIENFPALETMQINEFVTVDSVNYDEAYGDIEVNIAFVTEYEIDQQVLLLFGLYNEEVDENGEFIVEWIVLNATVEEDGTLTAIVPQVEKTKIHEAAHVAMAVLSEKIELDAE